MQSDFKVLSGSSFETNGAKAIAEATANWPSTPLQIVIVFHSSRQDAKEVAQALKEKFPDVPTIGCTTAGEYLNWNHQEGSLVLCGVASSQVRWSVGVVEDLENLSPLRAQEFAASLATKLGLKLEDLDSKKHFCLGFIDGLSLKEEKTAALLADAFVGIPCIGGSAGDDLQFKKTYVMANGKIYENAAVYALIESRVPFQILKHQHFLPSKIDLVVTEVDQANRRVITFDGYPAAERYAAVLGLMIDDLNPSVFSNHPLTFSCEKEIYVRSIQKVEKEGSLVFYCAVETGMVLELAAHKPMESALNEDLAKISQEIQKPVFFIGCNCILRSLEATAKKSHNALGKIIQDNLSAQSIGFDTYGEQLQGLHINQTLVGIIFGDSV